MKKKKICAACADFLRGIWYARNGDTLKIPGAEYAKTGTCRRTNRLQREKSECDCEEEVCEIT